jgi:hypothetical protein
LRKNIEVFFAWPCHLQEAETRLAGTNGLQVSGVVMAPDGAVKAFEQLGESISQSFNKAGVN